MSLIALPSWGQPRPTSRTKTLLRRMTIERQVAQLVMPWFSGGYVAVDAEGLEKARQWIDSLGIGGVIVSNGSPHDIAAKLNFLQRRSKIPLLVSADLEAGAAFRVAGATPFPSNMGVAATGRESDAFQMGRITAIEGRAIGIHLTFAPTADVNNNPANPIINVRAFGSDPADVARLVAATVKGIKAGKMLSTAKHFPGHGDTETDSHRSMPVIRADWPRLDTLELVPFRAAIAAGVDVVMSAHIAAPAVDSNSERPATLSPTLLTSVLRDSLRFRGLIITDAMDMGALTTRYGHGEAAILALLAGADILLMPADPKETIAAVAAAVRAGRISKARLRASVIRVLNAKEKLGLWKRRTVSLDRIDSIVGRQRFIDTARSIAKRSLVLVKDDSNLVANGIGDSSVVPVISYGDHSWYVTLPQQLTKRGIRVHSVRLYPMSGPASYDSARAVLARYPRALFSVAVRVISGSGSISMPRPLAQLIEETAATRPTMLVSFGSPYLLDQTPTPGTFLIAWAANPFMEEAVAAALAGEGVSGRLPIDLPPNYQRGNGLQIPPKAPRDTVEHSR